MNVKELITEKIRGYYAKGLTYAEIGKLLDISPRTVQRYITSSGMKKELSEPKTIQQKAFELSAKGFSYAEIAGKLRVTKTTVYNWHRKRKQA
jgi:DNA-directed RNA polymerase specialized sigma24 family protein